MVVIGLHYLVLLLVGVVEGYHVQAIVSWEETLEEGIHPHHQQRSPYAQREKERQIRAGRETLNLVRTKYIFEKGEFDF